MKDVPEPDAFILDRPREHYLHYGWNRHTCLGQYVSPVIIVESMIALLGLQDLGRPEPRAGRAVVPVRAPLRPAAARRPEPLHHHVLSPVCGLRHDATLLAVDRRQLTSRSLTCHIHGIAGSVASPLCASPWARAGAVARLRSRSTRLPRNEPRQGSWRPLKDDTSEEIVSWVDGQVVTDWAAEIAKRERAIDGYLNDADPARAEKYGFRSGQNPRLAWSWFRNNPVGFNGVPFVLFKTILDLDPNHQNPTLRAIARIWKHEASVPAGSGTSAPNWTLDHIGVGPDPSDYVDGVARPASERQSPLPFGFAFENPRSFEPLSATETRGRRRTAAGAARLSEHEPADRQAANGGQGGELGTRPAGLRQPGHAGSGVLFVRGLPRRPRRWCRGR